MKKRRFWHRKRSAGQSGDSGARSSKGRRASFELLEHRWLLSSVGFNPISNVTLPAGTAVYVPLNANDPGKTVSFAATVSDYSKVTPVMMPQTNKSLQLNVSGLSDPMVFQLFDNLAPTTASRIEGLVQSGYYNGLSIYRNGKDAANNPFVIQGGNNPPTGPIKTAQSSMAEEFNPNLQYTTAGILAMARQTAPNTSSTEFFITEEPARFLDFNYTAFGFQTMGKSSIQAISAMANQSTTQDPNKVGYLVTPLTISSATIFTDTQNGVLQLRAPQGVAGTVTVTVVASDGTNTPATQTFTVTIQADSPQSPANPFAPAMPAAPTSLAFVPPTSASSQTTNFNNSSSSKTLQFQVSGVTSGNVVQILADGNPIGQATATGTTVTVTTDGSTRLTDGTHKFTAIQIAKNKMVPITESGSSEAQGKTADVPSLNAAAVQLAVDATAPTATINQASTQADPTSTGPIHFTAVFSEAVTDFASADVTTGGTAAGTLTVTVTPVGTDGKTYDVAVSGMTGNGTVTASISAGVAHDAAGNANTASTSTDGQVTYQPSTAATKLFDFGTSSSPVKSGYTKVTDTTVYSSTAGYGWSSGTITSADRGSGADLDRDLNAATDGTFRVDLANGTYQVEVRMGDLGNYVHDQMAVYLAGVQVDTLSTKAGEILDKTYTVKVSGGKLDLRLKDMGDIDPLAVIESLTITPVSADSTAPTTTVSLAPGQPASAVVQPVYFAVEFSEPVTGFSGDDVTVGGTATQGTLTKTVSGSGANYVVAVSGFTASGTVTLSVPAGKASDLSGNQNQASPSPTSDTTVTYNKPATVFQYQFGTSTSPLMNGFTRATESTTYTAASKFGWTSGTIHKWDRGTGSAEGQAFNFTTDGTFKVDLANGTYQVDVTLGDTGNYDHDQMAVFLQGNQVDNVSTLAGEMVTKSYIAKVTDGHLLLQLKDLGDLDPNAVIHALVIGSTAADTTAPTVAVSLAPWQQSTAIAQPIYFAVDFSEPVTGFTADSVTVGGTATQATLAKTVTGIGANYVVAVSGFTASGTVTLNVPAGKATDLSGNQNQAAPSAATVTYSKPTSVLQYAFGAADSPLANGYTRVTRQTAYNGSSQKYGWASGTVVDWDRKGNGAALVRGFSFTGDGTFQADVANGTYRVDLILGDLGQYGHDQVGIFLQGETTARETVTTSRGQVLSKRYDSVTVSDGHLKVRLKDQGGDDPNAVLQAIDIALM